MKTGGDLQRDDARPDADSSHQPVRRRTACGCGLSVRETVRPGHRAGCRQQVRSDTPAMRAPAASGEWNGWGGNVANTRYQKNGGLTAADLPKLKLKWAFGYHTRHLRPRAADDCRRPAVRRQRERRSARARPEDRLHLLDVQGAGRRAHGDVGRPVQERRPRRVRPSSSATRAPTRTPWTPAPDSRSGSARSTTTASAAITGAPTVLRRPRVRAGAGTERRRPGRHAPSTSAARSAAASRRSTPTPATCCGRPTPSTSRSRAARTRTACSSGDRPAAASGRRRRSIRSAAWSTSPPATTTPTRRRRRPTP